MSDDESKKIGIATVTTGEAFEWYGEGKTSITGSRELELTYGISTSLELSAATSIKLGFSTEFEVSGSVAVKLGRSFEYSSTDEVTMLEAGSHKHAESYLVTVSSDPISEAKYKKAKLALKVLLSIQIGLAVAMAGYVVIAQGIYTSDGSVTELDVGELPLSWLQVIYGAITTIANIILLLVVKNRLGTDPALDSAINALSMDEKSGTFLGVRFQPLVGSSSAAGVSLSTTGLELATAKGLKYKVANQGTNLGFDNSAQVGSAATGGSRLMLGIEGDMALAGNTLDVTLAKPAGGNTDDRFFVTSNHHKLACPPAGANDALLEIQAANVVLQRNNESALVLANQQATLTGGNSALVVKQNEASLTSPSSTITLAAGGLNVTFGTNTLTVDATGFKMNADFQVLSPGSTFVASAVVAQIQANQLQLGTLRTQQQTLIDAEKTLREKQEELSEQLNQQAINLRDATNVLSSALNLTK